MLSIDSYLMEMLRYENAKQLSKGTSGLAQIEMLSSLFQTFVLRPLEFVKLVGM